MKVKKLKVKKELKLKMVKKFSREEFGTKPSQVHLSKKEKAQKRRTKVYRKELIRSASGEKGRK